MRALGFFGVWPGCYLYTGTENIQHVVRAVSGASGCLHHEANSDEEVSDKLAHAAAIGASLATSNLEATMMAGSQMASGPAVASATVVPTQHSEGVGIVLAGLVFLGIGKASKSIGLS